MDTDLILQLKKISKHFGDFIAVDSIDFELRTGEIHAILGENGAGKTTLMNLIYGLYQPTSGTISVSGNQTVLRSPRDAIANGIGMVHQHFMLVENLTVAENIALCVAPFGSRIGSYATFPTDTDSSQHNNGNTTGLSKFLYKKEEAIKITEKLSQKFSLEVDPNVTVRSLSVGIKQRVEILKALAVNARILILDEPTAVLSPQEIKSFFSILLSLQADNRSIIFISHKMKEVLDISDRITVLRRGKKVYQGKTGELSPSDLAIEMLGEELPEIERKESKITSELVLDISALSVKGNRNEIAVNDVSLKTFRGEIVGIAGVDGNGQRELAETIMGLRTCLKGKIKILGIQPKGTQNIRRCGVGYIPEDRQSMGVISTLSIAENLMLNIRHLKNISKWGVIDQNRKKVTTKKLVDEYDIRTSGIDIPASSLSGGNQQKLVLAREISPQPELLVAVNPTRGLDINAAQFVHKNLLRQCSLNKSILLISTELDEVLQLSDRIFVMSKGKLFDATTHRENIEALGLLMTGDIDSNA